MEIRQRLCRLLDGSMKMRAFQRWFVPMAWDIDERANPGAAELAGEIELRLAEYASGDLTADEFRELLLPLVQHYTLSEASLPRCDSTSEVLRPAAAVQCLSAARQFAAGSA